ncbi:hypothetical protein TRVL_03896 [Trypanosoma vivax]|nr:hypothetical protein TRVL_03896 [Trypanosoma vivax]
MGTSSSRPSLVTDAAPVDGEQADSKLRNFDTSPPTAAVIGAGIAGVHVAYELAQLGFRVTVFEQKRAVGIGETQYALPFAGIGLLKPSIFSLSMTTELLRAYSPFSVPHITLVEDSWNFLLSAPLHRWLLARRRSSLTEEQVKRYTNNLSRLSVSSMEELARQHKSLEKFIVGRGVSVQELIRSAPRNPGTRTETVPTTAHPRPLMVDPVGWTRELARISSEKYGVTFALGEKLVDSSMFLCYDTEMLSALRFSREEDGKTVHNTHKFDLVVLAAGASTGDLTWHSTQLPIIGVGGCSVVLQGQAHEVPPPLKNQLSPSLPNVLSLSPESNLVAYRAPTSGDANEETLVLQGLLSLDPSLPTQSNMGKTLLRMESYLRSRCGLNLPLTEMSRKSVDRSNLVGESAVDRVPDAHQASSLRATRYTRAFTPDGVPLITSSGGAFNAFACAGFGDHAVDMAPGAAKILAKMVELKALAMAHQDEEEARLAGRAVLGVVPVGEAVRASEQLQKLLNGYLACEDVGSDKKLEEFSQVPFSATRFGGHVKSSVIDERHVSIFKRISHAETMLMQAYEPWRLLLCRKATQLARHDNTPGWLRSIVYLYLSDGGEDAEALCSAKRSAENARRIWEQIEGSSGEATTATTRQSSSSH